MSDAAEYRWVHLFPEPYRVTVRARVPGFVARRLQTRWPAPQLVLMAFSAIAADMADEAGAELPANHGGNTKH